jgi:cell division protein FtsI/penicillin-binding protein 2
LIALAVIASFCVGVFARQSGLVSWPESRGSGSLRALPLSEPALPSVSMAAATPQSAPGPELPSELFGRLPVSAGDYENTLYTTRFSDPAASARWAERVNIVGDDIGALQVEYTFDAELTHAILRRLSRGRVISGHVIVLDPNSGRVLAYVSTDPEHFPPNRSYPAASLIKVVTAAAALDHAPNMARRPCVYRGNQYRLSRSRIKPPRSGNTASLERALATSNNQCFAQLAVNTVGQDALLDTIARFGLLDPPAPGHSAGSADPGDDDYDLGRLGCGLSGCRITPMHAAQLAATLATGMRVTPWWIDRVVDPDGRELVLPERPGPERVVGEDLAAELRSMLVRTTTHGTARSAFRNRRGRPKLGPVKVAGKTGNLSGKEPRGRYEWFIGAAPAANPTIAVAVVQLQGHLWWSKSSEVAAGVLEEIFCERGRCDASLAGRFTGDLGQAATPILLSDGSRLPAP